MNAFKRLGHSTLLILGLMLAGATVARADSLPEVRARMEQRLGKIDQLKASGAIGENNRGFVEARDGGPGAGEVISAENSDREKVYAAIAEKTKTSAEEVGRARARQIAGASSPGVWIQDASGTWTKK